MKVNILLRKSMTDEAEINAAERFFIVNEYHSDVAPGNLVIGRYSVLPFYEWVYTDLQHSGSELINSPLQHDWIADFKYYQLLKDFTPKTWFSSNDLDDADAPFIVKGVTNGRKDNWFKFMFAMTKADAIANCNRLQEDSLVGQQDIIFRKYHQLETFEIGINGLPITNEWRVFCYKGQIVTYGFYWSLATNARTIHENGPGEGFIEFATTVANLCSDYCNFYVIDIAKTITGEWIVIELNDGQMSGLSMIDPLTLYGNLHALIHKG